MANSTMKIDLIFQANTQAALNNIQQLNNLLHQIGTTTTIGVNSGSLDQAVQSAQQLQTHLAQAVNVDTGKLDLNKLNASLKQSGTNLQTLVTNLQAAGTQGQQAFVKLANSIASAQTPMLQVNQKLKEFGTTLLNTVKWQIASNMIHGIQSSLEGAISYAKNLNSALNDIRIVTGKSIDDMSKFTQTASKAAKELSSTTTEYAKAALIFYQQGLDGKAVEDRAEVVLKLAQVTGESAESISDQMTAVWNNFYDGSKSLEYYADVLTKLGATTASSTDEITQGLEKFAAVADTVGLSYEYAAASLATVVAETRQAPDVVGTAFKTLFARLQGLSLGETLEDGTDLNKYSEALAAVGVQIKNQYGELKDADSILDETAEKWRVLSKDQQVALAQTVGGMRQYSQFIALMDTWEDVELNVEVAELSTGELSKQQQIWSENWEAATKRVEQSKNELYENIIDDEALIKLQDGWAAIISGFSDFIDQIGGLIPFVLTLTGVFSKMLFPVLLNGFTRLKNNIAVLTGTAAKQVANMQNEIKAEISNLISSGDLSKATATQLSMSDKLITAKQELARTSKNLSIAEKEAAERKMAIIEATAGEIQKSLDLQSQWEQEIELLKKKALETPKAEGAVALTATETGGGKGLSDEEYQEKYGATRQQMAISAGKQTTWRTKQQLTEIEERGSEIQSERTSIENNQAELNALRDKKKLTEEEIARKKELEDLNKKQVGRLEELNKEEEELQKTYQKRKDYLEEILHIQQEVEKGAEASFGKIGGKEDLAKGNNFVLDDQQQQSSLGGMQKEIAENLNGSVETTESGASFIVADASIANLEKVYTLQGKYTVALEKTKAVTKDFTNVKNKEKQIDKQMAQMLKGKTDAQKKEIKQTKEYKKLEQDKSKALTATIATYKNSKSAMLDLASTAKLSDKDMEKLNNAFKQLDQGGDEAAQGMKTIDSILEQTGSNFKEANQGLEFLIQSFEELLSGKIPDDELDALKQRLKDLGLLSEQNAAKVDGLGQKLDGMGGKTSGWTSKLQTGITTIGNVAGSIMSAISAVQSFGKAFDEDAEPMERFSSYLMGIMGMIPVLNTLMNFSATMRERTAERNAKAAKKEQIAEGGPAAAKTFKGVLDTIGGVAGVIAGVIAAIAIGAMVIGGLFTAISISSNSGQSEGEKKEEALGESINQLTGELNAAKEAAEGFKEATSDYQDSIDAIDQLTKGTQEYKKAVEEANEKARELIETYGLKQSDYELNAEGIIEIDEEALKNKQAQFDKRVMSTQTQLNLDQAELAQVSAENKIADTDLDYRIGDYVYEFSDKQKMAFAEVAAEFGVNKEGVELEGDELKQAIIEGLSGTDKADLIPWLSQLDETELDSLKQFGIELRNAADASAIYANEMLANVSKMKYDAKTSELAGDDTGLKELMDAALITANDNLIDEEKITQEAIDRFDAAEDIGNRDYDTMTDDSWSYTNQAGEEITGTSGELGYMKAVAEDIAGEGFDLSEATKYQEYFGEGLSTDLAAKLASGTDVKTADLLKAIYESKGYTDVEIEDKNDGWLTVSAKGNEALGLEDIDEKDVGNSEAADQYADMLKTAAINHNLNNAGLSEEQAEQYLTQIQKASGNNAYGTDFTKSVLASIQNEDKVFDFSGIIGGLNADEVKELQNMSADDIMKLTGLDENMLTAFYGEDFSKSDLVEKFKAGLESWNFEDYVKGAKAAGEAEAEALELDTEEFKAYRDAIAATTDAYDNNIEGLNKVTIANQRLDRGTKKLADSWDDINDIMSDSSASAGDLATVMPTVNEGLQDMLNLSDEEFELLSPTFAQDNWGLIQDVVNGVEGAVDDLRNKAGEDILFNIKGAVDADGTLKEGLAELNAQIASYDDKEFEVGVAINDAEFLQNCQNMVDAAGMTAEQAQAYFASMGYDAEIEEKKVEKTTTRDIEYPVIDERTGYPTGKKKKMTLTEVTGTTAYAIKTITPNGSYGGGIGVNTSASSSSTNSGGGESSAAEKVEKTKRSDVVNRYEEIEDKLDDVRDAADKAAGAMDRLYGANRIKAMKDQAKALKDEVGLLEDKRKQAEQYLKEDTDILAETATEAGVRLEFDENGNVTNYTEQMDRLWKQLNDAENKKAGMSTKEEQDEFDETHIQPIQDAIDALKDAYDQYEDTREEIEDLDTEIQEAIYAWQDANAEILNYEIEIKTELNERELKKLDYYLGKMENDFYSMAESAALVGEKIKITNSALTDSQTNFDEINKLYNTINKDTGARGMSDEAYVEALKNEQDTLYDNLETLQELDDTMMNYYGDTLSMAQEELTKYTDRMDHSTSVLDHYRSLLDLTGQSQNFEAIGTVLEEQAKTIENSYQVAKQNYEWLADEAVKKKQAMNDAIARGDAAAAELFKTEWEAAEQAARDAQDDMLSRAEEWAGKLKEVLENKLSGISKILENALTGGRSFDELSMQMEHAQGIQEEYLTTTNKIYETNKMIRKAQNEIDKTTNTVAKQKLKAFQQETQQLQNQGQLSQFELDIQQKKYDLLLAEIALEEAQNAKSVVTLQRDSEGNFGYVYTADQNQVSGAEQGVEDAENALYNTRLEGANNYASQRQELLQGLYDSLTNLDNQYYIEGTISEEEYNRQKEAIQSYYFERLAQNSELYAIATEEDAIVSQEAWSTSLGIMDENASDLVEAVDDYLSESQIAFNQYQIGINKVAKETGVDLDTLASNVKDITDESDNLKTKVKDEVIPALQDELDKVSEVTGEYALHRDELALVMESYENLLEDIGNVIDEMSDLDEACDNVKTSAEQAASAVGSIGDVGPYASSGDGDSGGGDGDSGGGDGNSGGGDGDSNNKIYFSHGRRGNTWVKGKEFSSDTSVKILQHAPGQTYPIQIGPVSGSGNYGWVQTAAIKYWSDLLQEKRQGGSIVGKTVTLLHENLSSSSFDTGGYTGEWGPEGKLAWLHQKELVLNASQTEDLLMTMELLDSIIKQIDLMTMNNKVSQLAAATNEAANRLYREQMAQEVHIEANFPYATNRNEIYQALEMLANDTSQFINR